MRLLLLTTLLLSASALFGSTEAAALFRCGGGIVSASDSLERVAEVCGEPDERSERIVVRQTGGRWCDGRFVGGTSRIVRIEEWLFDFGPERLRQALTFENGALTRIESRGFGAGRARDLAEARRAERRWVLLPRTADRLRHRDR